MKKRFLILILVFSVQICYAQSEKRAFILESRLHSGINIPLYEALDYLIRDDIYAFDLSLSFPAYGKDSGRNYTVTQDRVSDFHTGVSAMMKYSVRHMLYIVLSISHYINGQKNFHLITRFLSEELISPENLMYTKITLTGQSAHIQMYTSGWG